VKSYTPDMIDRSWLDLYPENLRRCLQELLDDPDGAWCGK